jgi:8-oxo-dGTP diphosphatase
MGNIKEYKVRTAARGIVYKGNRIAIINVTKIKYFKLPGGGVEIGESKEEAFKREIKEETGCECKIQDGGSLIIEYRDRYKLLQLSYIYLAKVDGKVGETKLEPDEIAEGMQLEWMTLEEAEKVWKKDVSQEYEGHFIHLRDKIIFEFYKPKLKLIMGR